MKSNKIVSFRLVFLALLMLLTPISLFFLYDSFQESSFSTQKKFQLKITDFLQTSKQDNFPLVTKAKQFQFPKDHFSHPEYRFEWWYFTGNLQVDSTHRFGYQFTLFRNRLNSQPEKRTITKTWNTQQSFMAHFALTDSKESSFYAYQQFARGITGIAGEQHSPFKIYVEDWQLSSVKSDQKTFFPLRLFARRDGVAIDLILSPQKNIVPQGREGYSVKGPEPGNASYYYSITRLQTEGTIYIKGQNYRVSGLSWFDREWGSSMLSKGNQGWDWFALQLSDGTDIMFYVLRGSDNKATDYSYIAVIDTDSQKKSFPFHVAQIKIKKFWESPLGNRYPSGWQIQSQTLQLNIEIEPILENQELNLAITYWEGAVRLQGRHKGKPVTGFGYTELTGYHR